MKTTTSGADYTLSLVCCSDLVRNHGHAGLDGIFDSDVEKKQAMRDILKYLEYIEDYETCTIVHRELKNLQ